MSSWVKFIKRRKVLILAIAMVSFALFNNVPAQIRSKKHSRMSKMKRTLRHGNDQCAKSPYINVDQAIQLMPPSTPDGSVPSDVPSHVTLCQELINRNNAAKVYAEKQQKGEVPPVFTRLVVNESRDLCKDWSRPHSALMEIISSSIIAYVGKRFGLKYEHRCHTTIDPKSVMDSIPFDITNVQQIFPEATMPINERKIKLGDVVHTLCNACIEQYNNGGYDNSLQKTHHCLAFPYIQNVHEGTIRVEQFDANDPNAMPQVVMQQDVLDGEGHLVRPALASVMPLVKKRLYHAALDWSNRSRIPAHDPKSGVVIFLDANLSLAVPFWLFLQHISPSATHISILSGPTCAQGHLIASDINMQMNGGITCVKYALELRDYLQNHYRERGVQVSFELVSSSAASYSRMILSHTLICPPNTVSCLFPALAKENSKEAIILESPQLASTFHWFTYFGQSVKNIEVITLHPNQLVMDREQAMIDSQYAGFQVNEVMHQPQPQPPQPQPQVVQQQLPLPAPQGVSPQQQASSPQVVGDISMNIEQKSPEVSTEGYALVDDSGEGGTTNPFKTVGEVESDSEATYANTGEKFGNVSDGENVDMGITMKNNEDTTDAEDKLEMDFDFESLFGRKR